MDLSLLENINVKNDKSLQNSLDNELNLENDMKLEKIDRNADILNSQDSFLKNIFSKGINFAVDSAIRAVLPNIIEEQAIDIKNAIIKNGFSEGMEVLVDKVKEFGSCVLGIGKGKFNNISEMDLAIKKGGVLKTVSKGLSLGIDYAKNIGVISKEQSALLKNIKTSTINGVSKNIENELLKEVKKIEKLEKYQGKWYKALDEKDISKMEKYIKEINKLNLELVKFENISKNTEKINEIHEIILENGNFEYDGLNELLKKIV